MSLKKFLLRHADELASVAQVLGVVVSALPIDRQDKRNVSRVLEGLSRSADRIAKSAEKMPAIEAPIAPADLKAAVVGALPDLMGDIVEGVFREAKKQETPPVERAKPRKANAEETPAAKRKRAIKRAVSAGQ